MTPDRELREAAIAVIADKAQCPLEKPWWTEHDAFVFTGRQTDGRYIALVSPEVVLALLDRVEKLEAQEEERQRAMDALVEAADVTTLTRQRNEAVQKFRDYEHEVMTGRNAQHEALVAERDRLREALEKAEQIAKDARRLLNDLSNNPVNLLRPERVCLEEKVEVFLAEAALREAKRE